MIGRKLMEKISYIYSLIILFFLLFLDEVVGMVAITVDHKVRRESTLEAENVGKMLKDRGVDHRLVACEWPRGLPVSAPQVQTKRE